jgi:TolB-like protein/Flp pilus assembly protein TadD
MAPDPQDRYPSAGELARALGDGSSGAPATPATTASRRPRTWWIAAAVILLVAVGVTATLWPRSGTPDGSIVVLPFANMTPNEDNEYFSDGLTEEIITRLAAVPQLKVISRTSAIHYKGSTAPVRQIANELKVAHVLEGSVRQGGDQLRVTVQLIDARTDAHLWAETYDVPLRNVFAVQEQIAREVVRSLQVELGDEESRLFARRATRDTVAYELYRRGRYFWNTRTKEGHDKAFEYFGQAIARDSNYAEPYAGLADAYLTAYQLDLATEPEAEIYARLKWAAERALALHEQSADAHTAFAVSLWWQRNWPGAERELRRALQLNPGNANARGWYSQLLVGMGRLDEARRESQRALELDPFSIAVSSNAARACYVLRDYACAIEQHGRSLELSSEWVTAYADRGVIHSLEGDHDAAIRDMSKALELWPRSSAILADLAFVYARAGRDADARAYLRRAKLDEPDPFHVGRAHVALVEPDSAFIWLERGEWRWPRRGVRSDPALDPVRGDPRFARLSLRVDRELGLR